MAIHTILFHREQHSISYYSHNRAGDGTFRIRQGEKERPMTCKRNTSCTRYRANFNDRKPRFVSDIQPETHVETQPVEFPDPESMSKAKE